MGKIYMFHIKLTLFRFQGKITYTIQNGIDDSLII